MFRNLRLLGWFQLVLVSLRLRQTWLFGGFVVMMMTGGLWFPNDTGRTAWTVLGIEELQNLYVGMGNVLSVRVELAWFVLGAGIVVVFQVVAGCAVEIGVDFFGKVFLPILVRVSTVSPPFQVCGSFHVLRLFFWWVLLFFFFFKDTDDCAVIVPSVCTAVVSADVVVFFVLFLVFLA